MPRLFDAFAWLAVAIFFTGNVLYEGELGGHTARLEVTDWGFALVPLVIIALFLGPSAWRSSGCSRVMRSVWRHSRRFSNMWGWLAASALLIPFAALNWRAVLNRYWSFAGGWDLAIYSQACSHRLFSSLRDETTLMADHFEPILALFVPLCEVIDAPLVLLSAQMIVFAAGAFGVVRLARLFHWTWPPSILLGFAYMSFPGNRLTVFYDFHPIAFATAIIPWLVFAILRGRVVPTAILACLLISLKESGSLTLAGIGLWCLVHDASRHPDWFSKQRVTGAILGGVGLLSFLLIMTVAFPYFRDGVQSLYFSKYYGYLGSSLSDVAKNVILSPWIVAESLFVPHKMKYLLLVFAPFVAGVLFRPSFILPIVPALLINMLADHPYLASGRFHYEAEIYPWLFCAGVILSRDPVFQRRWENVRRFARDRCRLRLATFRIAWLAVLVCFFSGKSLSWYASVYDSSHLHMTMRSYLMKERAQWDRAKVAVFEPLVAHATNVSHLYILERWRDADWVVIGYPEGKGSWANTLEGIEKTLIKEMERNFELVYVEKLYPTFRVWKRRS